MAATVLIADDSVSMRQMTSLILKQAGYSVIQAVDGKDALSRFTPEVKLVLTDMNMPNMNGIELIRTIRSGTVNRGVPILMVTTESEEALKAEGKQAGATGWLVKPFTRDQLLQLVERLSGKVVL